MKPVKWIFDNWNCGRSGELGVPKAGRRRMRIGVSFALLPQEQRNRKKLANNAVSVSAGKSYAEDATRESSRTDRPCQDPKR